MKIKKNVSSHNFSSGLKHFMERCSLDEKKIADCCGVSVSLVYNWISGKNMPTYPSLNKLFGLGMTAEELFWDTRDSRNYSNVNQWTFLELQEMFIPSYETSMLYLLESQGAYNKLSKEQKLDFLCRITDECIAKLNELNRLKKAISKDQ